MIENFKFHKYYINLQQVLTLFRRFKRQKRIPISSAAGENTSSHRNPIEHGFNLIVISADPADRSVRTVLCAFKSFYAATLHEGK